MIVAAKVISSSGEYYTVWSCAKIAYTLRDDDTLLGIYPVCAAYLNGTNAGQEVVVRADFGGGIPTELGAALNVSFGMALWLALALHAVGVEIYVSLEVWRGS